MGNKKILVYFPYWGRGGAEIATMHLINVLKERYELYLVTRGGWDLENLNHVSHTSITPNEITIVKIPFSKILSLTTFGAIWHSIFLHYCCTIANKYDIRITGSRVLGWKLPAIHFLSDVVWNKQLNDKYGEKEVKANFLKTILAIIGNTIAGKRKDLLNPDDIFVANSNWTALVSRPYITTNPIVIYPPVFIEFSQSISWHERKNEFVMLGRISPEKRIEDAIEIIESLRNSNYNVGLTIYGAFDNSDYSLYIKKLIKNNTWVKAPGAIYGEEKVNVLPQFKYGINTCQREAFGISTAEMMKAGIITFVPKEGAQQEIVNYEDLIFGSIDDATCKIMAVLDDEDYQKELSEGLKKRSDQFSIENFRTQVNSLIKSLA